MSSIQKSIQQITALEELARKETPLHKMNASVKLIIILIYIITVVSFRSVQVSGLLLFACFPAFLMIIGEIPIKPLLLRCLIALPFVFFAGISNLILERNIYMSIGSFGITYGMVSFITLVLKTILTVMAVLLFMATTKMNDLIHSMHSLHIPSLIVIQIMMTYRYMSVLMKEASLMYHAYLLRAPREKGIKLADMGSFLGQLILRSIDRAERIYHAMQCRGFEGRIHLSTRESIGIQGWLMIIVLGAFMIMLRTFNLVELLGRIMINVGR